MFAQFHNAAYAAESEPDSLEHEGIPWAFQFYAETIEDLSIPHAATVERRRLEHEVEQDRPEPRNVLEDRIVVFAQRRLLLRGGGILCHDQHTLSSTRPY